ncbi:MAG: 3-deoxy-D-manno-octulosonic acid transferase [Halioglobus sp.]|nr:3-deoxy-D-manno-octulosonic acid transferase [Halioglobus sp.]
MSRHLYSIALYLLTPLLLLHLLWRSRRQPAYRRRLAERLGLFRAPVGGAPSIWVHAVSVGEVHAAAPLVEALLERYPHHVLVFTTTTPAGAARVRALFGARVFHVYLPWDLPGAVRRFLRRVRPQLLVLVETELWPNLVHRARAADCRVLLASARLSADSAAGYARLGPLLRGLLREVDIIACQSARDARRFLALGAPAHAVTVCGSLKFDAALAPAADPAVAAGERPLLVAGSTHPGEEEALLQVLARLRAARQDVLLVLAPRHTERADALAQLCRDAGWTVGRRSTGASADSACDVLLLDTLGELPDFYAAAAVAFVGGSLVPRGGQNTLEAAACGVPVVCGPHTANFARVNGLLAAQGALLTVADTRGLAEVMARLLQEPARRAAMGAAGRRAIAARRGARDALLRVIQALLAGETPAYFEPAPEAVAGAGGSR